MKNLFLRHHRQHSPTANDQRGQLGGIISTVLALAVAAIGLVYVVNHFNDAKDSTSSQGATTNFISMIGNIQKTYSQAPTGYTTITIKDLINNGDVPPTMVMGTTSINSPFGTPVTVSSSTITAAGDSAILSLLVPPQNCADFATALMSNVEALSISGTKIVDHQAGVEYSPSTLGTACSATGAQTFALTITR